MAPRLVQVDHPTFPIGPHSPSELHHFVIGGRARVAPRRHMIRMAIVLVACSRRALALAPRFPRAATRPRVGALHGSVVAPRMQRASALSATIAPPEESAESEPSEAVELPTNDSSEKLLE